MDDFGNPKPMFHDDFAMKLSSWCGLTFSRLPPKIVELLRAKDKKPTDKLVPEDAFTHNFGDWFIYA